MLRLKAKKLLTESNIQVVQCYGEPNLIALYINRSGTNAYGARYYYRIVDPNRRNLLTIDIAKTSGLIVAVEVQLYNGKVEILQPSVCNEKCAEIQWELCDHEGKGVPFDSNQIVELYDVDGLFVIEHIEDKLRFRLFKENTVRCISLSPYLSVELNDKDLLCSITLTGMEPDGLMVLKRLIREV